MMDDTLIGGSPNWTAPLGAVDADDPQPIIAWFGPLILCKAV
jgi:hypothetical protein